MAVARRADSPTTRSLVADTGYSAAWAGALADVKDGRAELPSRRRLAGLGVPGLARRPDGGPGQAGRSASPATAASATTSATSRRPSGISLPVTVVILNNRRSPSRSTSRTCSTGTSSPRSTLPRCRLRRGRPRLRRERLPRRPTRRTSACACRRPRAPRRRRSSTRSSIARRSRPVTRYDRVRSASCDASQRRSAIDDTRRPDIDTVRELRRALLELGPLGPDDQLGTLNHIRPERRRRGRAARARRAASSRWPSRSTRTGRRRAASAASTRSI